MKNCVFIKNKKTIENIVLGHHGHDVHNGAADADVKHQIRNAFVPVGVAKPIELSAEVFQVHSTPIYSSVYSIRIMGKCP